MKKSFLELVIGDLDEKRAYGRFMKRVNALPRDYCFAFKKIQNYMYSLGAPGCNMMLFADLLELFEESAAAGRTVLEVTGKDVAAFSDDLLRAAATNMVTAHEKLNEEILEHFHRGGK